MIIELRGEPECCQNCSRQGCKSMWAQMEPIPSRERETNEFLQGLTNGSEGNEATHVRAAINARSAIDIASLM